MKKLVLSCLLCLFGAACTTTAPASALPMQPAPSSPQPLATTCACGGDKTALDHASGCPCANHTCEGEGGHDSCGCGTGGAAPQIDTP